MNITESYTRLYEDGFNHLETSISSMEQAAHCFAQIPENEWYHLIRNQPKSLRKSADNVRTYMLKGINLRLLTMSGILANRARALRDEDKKKLMDEGVRVPVFKSEDSAIKIDEVIKRVDELTTEEQDLCIEPKLRKPFARIRSVTEIVSAKEALLKQRDRIETQKKSLIFDRPYYKLTKEGLFPKKQIPLGEIPTLIDDYTKLRKG